jgi:hypothetical protein
MQRLAAFRGRRERRADELNAALGALVAVRDDRDGARALVDDAIDGVAEHGRAHRAALARAEHDELGLELLDGPLEPARRGPVLEHPDLDVAQAAAVEALAQVLERPVVVALRHLAGDVVHERAAVPHAHDDERRPGHAARGVGELERPAVGGRRGEGGDDGRA